MGGAKRLSPLDATFLYWEKPNQRMHVGCVALLDGPVAFEPFGRAMEERLGAIPRYRERPVRPTGHGTGTPFALGERRC